VVRQASNFVHDLVDKPLIFTVTPDHIDAKVEVK
jgi:hypothetical protein